MVRDGLGVGFSHTNRHTFFEIIGSVFQKGADVVIPELHEQMLCVLLVHYMIVGQGEVSVDVPSHLLVGFGTTIKSHLHHFVGILYASPDAAGLDSPLVAAAHTCESILPDSDT